MRPYKTRTSFKELPSKKAATWRLKNPLEERKTFMENIVF